MFPCVYFYIIICICGAWERDVIKYFSCNVSWKYESLEVGTTKCYNDPLWPRLWPLLRPRLRPHAAISSAVTRRPRLVCLCGRPAAADNRWEVDSALWLAVVPKFSAGSACLNSSVAQWQTHGLSCETRMGEQMSSVSRRNAVEPRSCSWPLTHLKHGPLG